MRGSNFVSKRKAPQSLNNLLGKSQGQIKKVVDFNQHSHQLKTLLEGATSVTIAQNCFISNYRQGTLFIETSSSTIAMRLNFLQQSLIETFRQHAFPDLAGIKITITPVKHSPTNNMKISQTQVKQGSTRPSVSEETAESLKLTAELASGKLKESLNRLANRIQKKQP